MAGALDKAQAASSTLSQKASEATNAVKGASPETGKDLNADQGSIRVAFLPMTPLLIPELATGAAGELETLRAAALEAVDWACDGASRIGILAAGRVEDRGPDWSLDGFGRTIGDRPPWNCRWPSAGGSCGDEARLPWAATRPSPGLRRVTGDG